MQQTQVTSILSEPQRALLGTITVGQQVITTVERELMTKIDIPELGNDAVRQKDFSYLPVYMSIKCYN